MSAGQEPFRAPIWGSLIYHGDKDLMAFACLWYGGLIAEAFYHSTQAIEKYLKALALSIADPSGVMRPSKTVRWFWSHNLSSFAERCSGQYPYYAKPTTLSVLRRFSEYDQWSRYPWIVQQYGSGCTTADLPLVWELVSHLRKDLPIQLDNYPLGMLVRGHHHGYPEHLDNQSMRRILTPTMLALDSVFPNLREIVRW